MAQPLDGAGCQLPGGDEEEDGDEERGQSLEFAVAVGVILVRGLAALAHSRNPHHIRQPVEEGIQTVGDEGEGAGPNTHPQFGRGGQEVEGEGDEQNALDGAVVAVHRRSIAYGDGFLFCPIANSWHNSYTKDGDSR